MCIDASDSALSATCPDVFTLAEPAICLLTCPDGGGCGHGQSCTHGLCVSASLDGRSPDGSIRGVSDSGSSQRLDAGITRQNTTDAGLKLLGPSVDGQPVQ